MLAKSFLLLSAISAALAAIAGAWLALDSVQFLVGQFRPTATVGILAGSCGLLVASALLVRRPGTGRVLAAICAVAAVLFVVGGLGHMSNTPLAETVAQATCARGAAICYPQAATFIYSLIVLCLLLLASSVASWLGSKRGVQPFA